MLTCYCFKCARDVQFARIFIYPEQAWCDWLWWMCFIRVALARCRGVCAFIFILFFLNFAHTPSANGDERRAESHLRDMVRVSITVVNLLKLTRLAVLYVWRWSAVEDHEGCVQYRQIYHFNTADSWITKYFPFLSLHQKGPRLRKNKTFNIRSSQ